MKLLLNFKKYKFLTICLSLSIFFFISFYFMNPNINNNDKTDTNESRNLHPYILLKDSDFKRINREIRTDQHAEKWYKQLQSNANVILNSPINKNSKLKDNAFRKIFELSFMYKITHDEKYAIRTWQELKSISTMDWNTKHFLDTADYIEAVSIGYDWLYNYWDPRQRRILQKALIEKGLKPALDVYEGKANNRNINTFWVKTNNNWNSVCNSGVGIGALAVKKEYPNLSKEILKYAVQSIKKSLKIYSPDGGMPEGPSYWNYATLNIALFLSALDSAVGTDLDLSRTNGFSDTAYYPIYMSSGSHSFNVGDAGSSVQSSSAQMLWFANKFNNSTFRSFGLKSNDPLSLIWYHPKKSITLYQKIPLDYLFKNSNTGIVTMRNNWSANSLFVGLHWGNNHVNHGDLDIGDFVLDYDGIRWASDLGGDNYNLPGYFDMNNDRWLYYRKRAEGQNTLVINPSNNPDQNIYGKGKILDFSSSEKQAKAIVDITDAYSKYALAIKRSVSLSMDRNAVILQDKIILKHPYDLYWFMHTYANIELSLDKKTAILSVNGKKMIVHITSPNEGLFSTMKAAPLPSSPHPDYQGKNNNVRKLVIHLRHTKHDTITVIIIPADKTDLLKKIGLSHFIGIK